MRSIVYREYGGPEVLEVATVSKPEPRPGEVLVEVDAIGVNPTETYPREGLGSVPLPRTPGGDVAGRVVAVGPGVQAFEVGDRVFGTGLQNDRQGTYAEYVPARVERLAPLPDAVSSVDAAAIGVVGVTAWQALVDVARVRPTDRVLVHGGSGGVGHVAVQLAGLAGGDVVATAGTERARERVRELGADATVDYADPDLADAIAVAMDGHGMDVILDHRVGDYLQLDIDVSATGGRIVGIGSPRDDCRIDGLLPALTKDVTVHFVSMSNTPELPSVLERLATLLADDRLTVDIAREFDLADASEAHRTLESDHFVGKLVLRP